MAVPSLSRSIATSAIGFGLVSLCVFATVAFAERLMLQNLGSLGSYLAWIALFILHSRLARSIFCQPQAWQSADRN